MALSAARLRYSGKKGALTLHRAAAARDLALSIGWQGHGLSREGSHQGDPTHIQGPDRPTRAIRLPGAHCGSADDDQPGRAPPSEEAVSITRAPQEAGHAGQKEPRGRTRKPAPAKRQSRPVLLVSV